MGGFGSGGHNRKTAEQHRLEGSYRRDRHGAPREDADPDAAPEQDAPDVVPIAAAVRRRALRGLSPAARRIAAALLAAYGGWDEASLATLRAYVLSCERLEALQATGGAVQEIHREVRANLALLRALKLE